MNRNNKAPDPVLIKRKVIEDYLLSYKKMLDQFYSEDTTPTYSLALSGRLMECSFVLKTYFNIPEEILNQMDEDAQNEAQSRRNKEIE